MSLGVRLFFAKAPTLPQLKAVRGFGAPPSLTATTGRVANEKGMDPEPPRERPHSESDSKSFDARSDLAPIRRALCRRAELTVQFHLCRARDVAAQPDGWARSHSPS